MNQSEIKQRLEYLRGEIQNESISMGEIAELQSLAEHIDEGDVVLLQWAGVPENKQVNMTYSLFLFSQLFMNFCEGNKQTFKNLEYDRAYPHVIEHYNKFEVSSYNLDTKGEYDCMSKYIHENVKPF